MATATDAVPGLSLPLAPRMHGFPAYPLADVPQIKRDLTARGIDVIDLGAGDADLAAPPAAIEALREAALTPAMGRYAFQLGLPAFRESVAAFMERRFGVQLDPFREIAPLLGTIRQPRPRHASTWSVRSRSAGSTASCWSTTMPTARSRSTVITRRAFWSSMARGTSRSSSTRSRRRST
jgi:hypothetical protein